MIYCSKNCVLYFEVLLFFGGSFIGGSTVFQGRFLLLFRRSIDQILLYHSTLTIYL